MEIISRILDGSIPRDLKDVLREPGARVPRVDRDDKVRHLQRVPMFTEFSQRQLRAIAAIARVIQVPAGTVLTRKGEPGNEFFIIVDGSARVEAGPRKTGRLRPSDFFGEMSLLDGEPRSATVVGETDLRLVVIERRDFRALLAEAPELTQSILAVLSRRVRSLEKVLNG